MMKTPEILRAFVEASLQQASEVRESLCVAHAFNALGLDDREFTGMIEQIDDHIFYCEEKLEVLR